MKHNIVLKDTINKKIECAHCNKSLGPKASASFHIYFEIIDGKRIEEGGVVCNRCGYSVNFEGEVNEE